MTTPDQPEAAPPAAPDAPVAPVTRVEGAPLIVVAAGGTGGHLFPAEALAVALAARGAVVDLATDERAFRWGGSFPARATHIVPSATLRGRDPKALVKAAMVLGRGILNAYRLYGRIAPRAVVGFGGYPTLPPVLAATLRGIPTVIHEQNGIAGRANRLLAPRVSAIATGFPGLFGHDPRLAAKSTHTGNPVRPAVLTAAAEPYPGPDQPFRLLVFGGSQGARIMADIVPPAVELLPVVVRSRVHVVQQARDEDVPTVEEAYARMGVPAEVKPFFRDLPARIAAANLVISRAGASTVAELAAIGRPAILVPLPHALDQDQMANAAMLEKAGGALRIKQAAFSPERLAAEIARLATDPAMLPGMAAAARRSGALDAADRLAELVLRVAGLVPAATAAPPEPAKP